MKSSYFVLLLAFSIISSSLIFENTPSYVEKYRFYSDLLQINQRKAFQKFSISEINNTIEDETLTLSNITPFAHFIFPEETDFSITDDNSYKIQFNKNTKPNHNFYLARYSAILKSNKLEGKSFKIYFSFSFSEFSLTKHYQKYSTEYFYYTVAECNLALDMVQMDYTSVSGISSGSIDALLATLLKRDQQSLVDKFKTSVDSYYAEIKVDEVSKDIITNTFNSSISHKLDLNRDNAPKYQSSSILNYFSGQVDTEEQSGVIDLPIDIDVNKYGIYINKNLIINLMKNNLFGFYIENSTKFMDEYELSGKYLKKICDIGDEVQDNLLVKIEIDMEDIKVEEQKLTEDGLKGKVTFNTDIYSANDESKLLSYHWDLDFLLRFNLFQNGLNFVVLGKDTSISGIAGSEEPARKITDEALLKKWMEDTIKIGLIRKQYNFFKYSIDLTEYFNSYGEVTVGVKEDYITLVGKPKL